MLSSSESIINLFLIITITLIVCSSSASADERQKINEFFKSKHTNNWAVLVCSSRYWFNYRHVANVLSIYRSVKRLGIPDSRILLMLADDMPCNARNIRPGTVFNNANHHINVYGNDVEVDYRGYEVTVKNFIRLLTGRVEAGTPRSKQLLTDEESNILIYLTGKLPMSNLRLPVKLSFPPSGHGGDGFLKFQDSEEITSIELADAFEQMWQKRRYNEILLITETCQAESMGQKLYSPNIIAVGSSKVGEDSLSHHGDPTIGVYVIDRYTFYALEYLEAININSTKSLASFFAVCPKRSCLSTVTVRSDLFQRDPVKVPLTDFFGSVPKVRLMPTLDPSAAPEINSSSPSKDHPQFEIYPSNPQDKSYSFVNQLELLT